MIGSIHATEFKGSAEDPFGGMNVILLGDFHQFPPVANPKGALYVERADDGQRVVLGREIFKQFETVVILDKQVRVKDNIWTNILNQLRIGECTEEDVQEINKLVLSNSECNIPDFTQRLWSDAILFTPRHGVREVWNEHSVAKHYRATGNIRYIAPSEDVD